MKRLFIHVFEHTRIVLTPGVTTKPASPVCPECGTIQKSGKASCCARGGSWFGNCRSGVMNAYLGHTWSQGIEVCKAWQPHAVGAQRHNPQANSNVSSNYAAYPEAIAATNGIMIRDSDSIVMPTIQSESVSITATPAAKGKIISPVNGTVESWRSASTDMSIMTSSQTSDTDSIKTRRCGNLLHLAAYISMIYIILC